MHGQRSLALAAAPAALAWLAHTRIPRCLHVFDRACNLMNEYGEILSIVAPEIGNGPFNLVIADPYPSFERNGGAMSPITITRERLAFGSTSVDIRNLSVWRPKPDWRTLHEHRAGIIGQLPDLYEWIRRRAKPDSLLQLRFHPLDNQAATSKDHLTSWTGPLCAAVASADIESCRAAARHVAGRGAGLTPAGDDLMLGAIYAAWVMHPPERAGAVARAMAGSACPRTTSLSSAWLRAGSRGEAGILWHDFLRTLLIADKTALHRSVDKLLAVGHTSGADALAGFAGSLLCCPPAA